MGAAPSTDLQSFKAEFFKALAHPLRIRILEILRAGERSVQELQTRLDLDQSTVSQQLAVLRAKNIVAARKEGTTVRYEIRDPLVGDLLDVARRIFNNQLAGTQTMLRELRQETRRPARRGRVSPASDRAPHGNRHRAGRPRRRARADRRVPGLGGRAAL